ncbi:MAG: OmpH family outer membrane protein [Verrucomicrobia bacterium]|nr:OmpH family outer membrane protein [Verrucomicrobiota bacterium]
MKKSPVLFLSALLVSTALFAAAAAPAAHGELRIGTVDMNKVFSNYYKTKDAETKINEQKAAAQTEFNSRMDSYRKSLDEITQINKDLESNKALSPAAKEEKSKRRESLIAENQSQQRDIENFRLTREKQIQEQIVRLRNQMVEDIMKVVNDKVKSENFDLIFDRSGNSMNGVNVVIFARDNMDFSDVVIKELNRNKPAETAATPTPAAGGATPAPVAPPRR